jgi:succinate dehydrogenase / fumarate reductase iron-sulfur subunit
MAQRTIRVWRGDAKGGEFRDYSVEADEGMVVLDLVHRVQAEHANDLAVRWNCKAGKCGSCSMEINGKPKLGCMTRVSDYGPNELITVQPLKTFPIVKDLVTDVSWNYQQNKRITPFTPPPRKPGENYVMMQEDVDRVQEFRKCIECFLCQDTCHVLRDHERKDAFVGPRFMIRLASLDMHPLDTVDRIPQVKNEYGSGYCNITRCCTEVCPEHIGITDNAIIPLKERVVDQFYDPILWVVGKIFGKKERKAPYGNVPAQNLR